MNQLRLRTMVAIGLLGAALATAANAEDTPEFVGMEKGRMIWTNINPALYYSLEWNNYRMSDPWRGAYDVFQDLQSTNGTLTAPIPAFFRVRAHETTEFFRSLSATSHWMATGYYWATNLVEIAPDLASDNIRAGATIFGVTGDANLVDTGAGDATSADLLADRVAFSQGAAITGAIQTLTLSATTAVVRAGYYAATNLVQIAPNLTPDNIRLAINLFGVTGTLIQATGNAEASELLEGRTAIIGGEEVIGTMPNIGAQIITPSAAAVPISLGYHDGTGSAAGDGALIPENIRAGSAIFGVTGAAIEADGVATAGQVLDGVTFSRAGAAGLTGSMPDQANRGFMPAATNLPIPAGYYDGSGVVTGDVALISDNIRKEVVIFGVEGAYEPGIVYSNTAAALPQTGQIDSSRAGDDGDHRMGVAWPTPRFFVEAHGADELVTDAMTGLSWARAPHTLDGNADVMTWEAAIDLCNQLVFATYDDWRLPNVREQQSLIDYGRHNPALPADHPFSGIQPFNYWTGTTQASTTNYAWRVRLTDGHVGYHYKTLTYGVWPVRGGN